MEGLKLIIGIIGPVSQENQIITELLTEEKSIQVVDGLDVVRAMDRKHRNSLISKDYHKKLFLKQLESELGTYIITGNLLLSQNICSWLLKEGNTVVIVNRDNMEAYEDSVLNDTGRYLDDNNLQKYELEQRFKQTFKVLQPISKKSLYWIDLSDEESDDLNRLVELKLQESKTTGLETSDLISIITRKEDKNMTMEESIKKAMRELGIEDDTIIENPAPIEKKPEQKPIEHKLVSGVKQTQELSENNSIFVKFTDTNMAILFPVGIQLERKSICGVDFNVATLPVPNLKDRKLQELELIVEKPEVTEKKPEQKPIEKLELITEPPVNNPEKKKIPIVNTDVPEELEELKAEKARLDGEIKKYRSEGNMDMVNSLRKQRRIVRGKINKLK